MYVTIDDIIGEKMVDLDSLTRGKDVTVVSMFSDNIQYEFMEPWNMDAELSNKWIKAGNYTRRELIDLVEGVIERTSLKRILE